MCADDCARTRTQAHTRTRSHTHTHTHFLLKHTTKYTQVTLAKNLREI